MFWGGPGVSHIGITSGAQVVRFEFVAAAGATNGTLHFRFGRHPGRVVLDDVHVTALPDGDDVLPACDFEGGTNAVACDWTFWPRDAANTVGAVGVAPGEGRDGTAGLGVTLRAPPGDRWPDFHVYCHPRLRIEAGRHYSVSFWIRTDAPRAVSTALYRPGDPFVFLGGPGDAFDAQLRLAAQAGVKFVSFPIDLPWPEPGSAADWTAADAACRRVLEAHPSALLIPRIPMDPPAWWRAAHPDEVMHWEDGRRDKAVPASPVYRRDAAARLSAVIGHLEETFGNHVAGYHPVGQNTGEWFYDEMWQGRLSGFAPADRDAWRAWLARRYATDAELQSAWADPGAARAGASLPTASERRAAPHGLLHDPATEQRLVDWAEFQQDAMAGCVMELAHAARQASRGRKLVLFFYGYVFELAGAPGGAPVSGHYALRQVLDCPDIDVLCAPIAYFDRGLGGSAPAMSAAESVALAGKLWLNEDDTHTCLATEQPPGWQDHVSTVEDTNRELLRNVAQASLRNFGTWWMDLCRSGWFNDERLWAGMKQIRSMDDAMRERPTPFRPEIAAVVDERAMRHLTAASSASAKAAVYDARRALGRCGAPYGQYLLDDVLAGRVPAKLLVLLGPTLLDDAERTRLAKVAEGRVCLWCRPAGFGEPMPGSPERVVEPAAFTTTVLREAAQRAGVHLFATNDCVVYANGGFLALHAVADGPLQLDTGRDGEVVDLLSGRPAGRGPQLRLELRRGETRIFRDW